MLSLRCSLCDRQQDDRARECPPLPQEIIDVIIDQVAGLRKKGTRRTLLSCSLTCKSWLPRSTSHLFNATRVSLHQPDHLELFHSMVKDSTRLANHVRFMDIELEIATLGSIQETMDLIVDMLCSLLVLEALRIDGYHDVDEDILRCEHPFCLRRANAAPPRRLQKLILDTGTALLMHTVLSLFLSVDMLYLEGWQSRYLYTSDDAFHRFRYDVTDLILTASCLGMGDSFDNFVQILPCLQDTKRIAADLRGVVSWKCYSKQLNYVVRHSSEL